MRILLSNDDGYFAPGLSILAETLSPLAEIIVVAPERDRSGASIRARPRPVSQKFTGLRV